MQLRFNDFEAFVQESLRQDGRMYSQTRLFAVVRYTDESYGLRFPVLRPRTDHTVELGID